MAVSYPVAGPVSIRASRNAVRIVAQVLQFCPLKWTASSRGRQVVARLSSWAIRFCSPRSSDSDVGLSPTTCAVLCPRATGGTSDGTLYRQESGGTSAGTPAYAFYSQDHCDTSSTRGSFYDPYTRESADTSAGTTPAFSLDLYTASFIRCPFTGQGFLVMFLTIGLPLTSARPTDDGAIR